MNSILWKQVEDIVGNFWRSEFNTLGRPEDERAWDRPVLAVAAGDDPLFEQLKQSIGPFYWTPLEALNLAFPGADLRSDELSVISWVLPQTAVTLKEQGEQSVVPGRRWAASRFYGEEFNVHLMLYLASRFCQMGVLAVAPECLPGYSGRCRSPQFGMSANWSERHVAWVAGHGTFGLSDGLITRVGKAVRFGSVVVAARLPVSPRAYLDYGDWCLYFSTGRCGACISRCPAGAISRSGHDKEACLAYINTVTTPHVNTRYGTGATPCGLCQAGIPCASGIPSAPGSP